MKIKSVLPVDPSKCPLCGKPNHCAMAADPAAKDCWCGEKKFPRELLEQIPEEAVRKVCICQECLQNYLNEQEISDASYQAAESNS